MSHGMKISLPNVPKRKMWRWFIGTIIVLQILRAAFYVSENGFNMPKFEHPVKHGICSTAPASELTDEELRQRIAAKFYGDCQPQSRGETQ